MKKNRWDLFVNLAEEYPALAIVGCISLVSLPISLNNNHEVFSYIILSLLILCSLHCLYDKGIKDRSNDLSERNKKLIDENTLLRDHMTQASWQEAQYSKRNQQYPTSTTNQNNFDQLSQPPTTPNQTSQN